jgi:hypothetical protein
MIDNQRVVDIGRVGEFRIMWRMDVSQGNWHNLKIIRLGNGGPRKRNFWIGWNFAERRFQSCADIRRLADLHPEIIQPLTEKLERVWWEAHL